MTDKELLNSFKEINLAEFAQCFGFVYNKQSSSRKYPVLKKAETGHTIVIKQQPSGHFTFFESGESGYVANGTIIDFLLWQNIEYHNIPKTINSYRKGRLKPGRDIKVIQSGNAPTSQSTFTFDMYSLAKRGRLEERHILPEVIGHPVFKLRIGSHKGTVCFPLFNKDGLCGLRKGKRHIVAGSIRGLWSANRPDLCGLSDSYSIFITESPIDNLSYQQIKGGNNYHLSTIGNPTAGQLETIKFIAEATNAPVLLGFDNDENGDKFAAQLENTLKGIVPIERVRPTLKDWNDDLKAMCKEQALIAKHLESI